MILTDFVENLRIAGLNKLRTDWRDKTEAYCKIFLPLRHRSAFAKFRCGVAPLRIETGRYENRPLEDRICPLCDKIESEIMIHVLFNCYLYDDFRNELFRIAPNVNHDFNILSLEDKLIFISTFL